MFCRGVWCWRPHRHNMHSGSRCTRKIGLSRPRDDPRRLAHTRLSEKQTEMTNVRVVGGDNSVPQVLCCSCRKGTQSRNGCQLPPYVTCSPSAVSSGAWTVTRLFFTARCGADPLLKVRHATVLTPPFVFLHQRRVVVVQTLRIHTALPLAQPPAPPPPRAGWGAPPVLLLAHRN